MHLLLVDTEQNDSNPVTSKVSDSFSVNNTRHFLCLNKLKRSESVKKYQFDEQIN